jgi:hypothetical protein
MRAGGQLPVALDMIGQERFHHLAVELLGADDEIFTV